MLGNPIRDLGAAFVAATLLAAHCPPAAAQTAAYCGKRAEIVKYLDAQYQEGQHGLGLVNQTLVFELFVGPNGSWTLIATKANGVSCLVGSGDDWQDIANPPPEPAVSANPAGH